MKKCINGNYIEMTAEEIAETQAQAEAAEREHWQSLSYDEAVDTEIRKKYSEYQVVIILLEKEERPERYREYCKYRESCEAFVKQKKEECENGCS